MKLNFRYKYNFILAMILIGCCPNRVFGQISGSKYIPGDYATVTAGIAALNTSGVGIGGVTFNIAAGYTETITATLSVTATGTAVNPIVFQKDPTTTGANPLITAYTGGTATPASSIQDGIWRLIGSDYITISGIDLRDNPANTTNPSTMEYGYALYKASSTNGCQFVTIQNCTITLNSINNANDTNPMTEGCSGIIMMNATATGAIIVLGSGIGGTNSNNKFYGNIIQNCNNGISMIGVAAASPYTLSDANNDIGGNSATTGNTIINFGGAAGATNPAAGIRTLNQYGLNVSYNTINNNNGSGANHITLLHGILVGSAAGANTTIANNTVTLKGGGTTATIWAIECAAGSTAIGNTININNNNIINSTYTIATSANFFGIYNTGAPATLNINGNTLTGNSTAATTGSYTPISNLGAVTTAININSNYIGTSTAGAVTYTAANSVSQTCITNTTGSNTAALSISNNNIQGIVYAIQGTGPSTYISNIATTLSQAINGNTFTALNVNTTGNVTFISNSVILSATGTQNINNNSIVTSFTKSGDGGTVSAFNTSATSLAGGVSNNNSNNFSNINLVGTTVINGWINTDAGGATKTIQNNTFSNWVTGTGQVNGMNINLNGANCTVSGNTISNITGAGTITGITTAAGNESFFANTINSLYTTGSLSVNGIAVTSGSNKNIYGNKIYDLQANNTSGATVNGIVVSGTSIVNANIYNNLIGDLRTPSSSATDPIRGISIISNVANSTINVYYNTIYLNASSTGATFGTTGIYHLTNSTATNTTLNLRNNIVNNVSTANGSGLTVAYRRSSNILANYAATSNNNLFYSGPAASNRLIFYDGTNSVQTLTAYKALVATRDAQSVTEDLVTTGKFLSTSGTSASFLHMDATKPTQVSGGGINILGYTTDYDGQIRAGNVGDNETGVAPDIGADEFTGIVLTALSGTYSVGAGQTYTSLTSSGGLFAAINSLGLAGSVVVNITSDLTEDGSNTLYQWAESGSGNYSLTIQPDAATSRLISGNVIGGMIRFNGTNRVIIDGRYSGSGTFITFRNVNTTGTTGTAFTFINAASNNILRYINAEAYASGTNGVILFGISTVTKGNSNNTISNCNINSTVGINTGSLGIYSAGTLGSENVGNIITNNHIFNYRDKGLDIAATGSSNWTISGNSFDNGTISGSVNYAATSILYGIRVLGGTGYSILNNSIGGSANLATGSNAVYSSTLGNVAYYGIQLTSGSGASNIKGNIIRAITVSSIPSTTNANEFVGIETIGAGVINVGGISAGDGNIIGSNTTNGAIIINTNTTVVANNSFIRGIDYTATNATSIVMGNQIGGIDINNTGSTVATAAPSAFQGIVVNATTAPAQINNNVIGSAGTGAAANSIRVISASTANSTSLTGLYLSSAVVSTVQLNANIIQNMSQQVTTVVAGPFYGIYVGAFPGANISLTNNSIKNNSVAPTTAAFYGIYNNANPTSINISSDTVSNNTSTAGTAGIMYGVFTQGASTLVAINNNTFANNSVAVLTSTPAYVGFYNNNAAGTLSINNNAYYSNTTASTASASYFIRNTGAVTGSINIDNNTFGTATLNAITFSAISTSNLFFIDNTGGTSTASLSISNNRFQGINYTVGGTGGNVYVNNTATTLSQAINGNTFINMNVNTSGNLTFISNNVAVPATGTQNVNNNSITGTFAKTAGSTITLFTSTTSCATGSVINNNNNNFSNITVTGNTPIAGWVNIDGGSSTKTIQNNTFTNWSAGTGSVNGMNINLTGTNNSITGNIINNITAASTITGITTAVGNNNIYANTINTLSTTSSAAVNGIAVTNGTTANIYKNKIYDLSNNNVNGTVNGILVSGGTTVNVYNNLIGNLRTPIASTTTDQIRGISVTSATLTSNINVYYNTIYLNATSTGTNFSSTGIYHVSSATATTAALNLRNNSITNTSTPKGSGITVAYRRLNSTLTNYAATSNNNLFYAGTPGTKNLIFYDGTNSVQTMVIYKALVLSRDIASVTEDETAKFLSTTGSSAVYLHMNSAVSSLLVSGAVNITGFTDDFDGQVRAGNTGYTGSSSSPDIGADEVFGVETIPPAITYTALTNTTSTANRSVTGITITDASGVNIATGTKPRIYYKRNSDVNVWLDNSPGTNGWKYTEATNSSSPYTFTIDYSLLYGGASVTAGVIQYFIVAQDVATTANIAVNSGTFASSPSSVALTSAAFPISGTINNYNIPFSGTYNVGTTEVFTSLTKANGLFASINTVGLAGSVTVNMTSDVTEDGANALNQWTESGAGSYTLTIQPDAASLRTISGNVATGLIRLNGADRVTIDGRNGGSGIYLSFKNTNTIGTIGSAFAFTNGATNNVIRYSDAEAYADATDGVILFGTSTIAGGNSNNLVDNCTINATVSGNVGSVGVYSSGTVGNENATNTISNNIIYDYRDRGLDITATGSTGWIISGNSLYNGDVTGAINYAASSSLQGIRVLGGSGYTISNNVIGGGEVQVGGINALYASTLGNVSYQGILLTTTGASPASNIKGNTIADISVSSAPTAAGENAFTGIETHGLAINIGGTGIGEGNGIGSSTVNGSITINTSTTSFVNSTTILGINCTSSAGVINNNSIGGIDINNGGASPAPSSFQAIYINNASAPTQVNNNLIGSATIGNSVSFLASSGSVTPSLTGIEIGTAVNSSLQINANSIQNVSNLSTVSSGSFIGIKNTATLSGAIVTISIDTIQYINTAINSNAGSTVYDGIISSSASTITNNIISNITLSSTGINAQITGIQVSGAYANTIFDNVISNLSTTSNKVITNAETGNPSASALIGILSSATGSGQNISGNTISALTATSGASVNVGIIAIGINSSGSGSIFKNKVGTSTNITTGSSPVLCAFMIAGGSYNVYNNSIRVSNLTFTTGLKIYGIVHASASNCYYFHNSVRVGGNSVGTSLRSSAFVVSANGAFVLKDNVFVNIRTGAGPNYAISNLTSNLSTWSAGASDYNDIYSAEPTTIGEWGAAINKTFSALRSISGGDAHSVSATVSFATSVNDLKPDSVTNCSLNGAGTPITSPVIINTDIFGVSRSSLIPDLGAYEFSFTPFAVVATNNSPVCSGGTVGLSVNTGTAFNPNFSWRSPLNTIVSTNQNPNVTPVAGWYKVTVTDSTGCSATDSTQVFLNSRPTGTLTGTTALCSSGSATLSLAVTGTGTISGTLSSGDSFSGTAPLITVVVTPGITTVYTIVSLSDASCTSIPMDLAGSANIVVTQPGSWLGITSSDWNDTSNWCGGVPLSTTNVTIPAGLINYPVIDTGTSTSNDITIASGASLTVTGAELEINGTIINAGTFTASNGTIEFNGITAQTISAAVFTSNLINNLIINNAAGVALGGALNVSGVVSLTNGQLNTGGYLTLKSTVTQTALIDASGAGNISGNVTMERYLAAGYGYKYFSSPFQAATVSNFATTVNLSATFSNFYNYIENQASSGFTPYTTGTNILNPLQGYAVNFGSVNTSKTISITGAVNNGAVSSTLFNHNQPYTQGFNLVGNPYPSPIDWNATSGWTKTNIDDAIYYFDSGNTSQYTGTYSTYINGISSDGVAGNIIASMQGFFVHVSNGTYPVTGTFAVNNNVRVNNLSPVFHKSTFAVSSIAPRTLLRLSANFSDNVFSSDPLVVYTSEKATPIFDGGLDAVKLMNTNEQIPNLYIVGVNSTKLVIHALTKLETPTVIPLGLQTSRDGTITLNLRNLEQFPNNLHLYLSDAETGVNQDLQQNPEFKVSLKQGTYENRFSLRCDPAKATLKAANEADIYLVYKSAGTMFMRIKLVNQTQGTLTVTNIMGQIISRKPINGNGDYELEGEIGNNTLYVACFTTKDGVYAKKFFR